jgi:carbon-monoxide dehydrogenase large subunit
VKALEAGAPQLHPEAPGNLIYDWQIGDANATDAAIAAAAHVTEMTIVNNRLVPNAMEPRAALGHYDKPKTTIPATRRRRTRMSRAW